MNKKFLLTVGFIICGFLIFDMADKWSKYEILKNNYEELKALYEEQQSSCQSTIEKLNNDLLQYTINKEQYESCIRQSIDSIDSIHMSHEKVITESLKNDDSLVNQMKVMQEMINEFGKGS